MSPGRPRSPQLRADNERLKADLHAATESFDREVASRLREESERTLEKVEDMWRISKENEELKAELQRERQERERLEQAFAAIEAQLSKTKGGFDRYGVGAGLCSACDNLHQNPKKLETASYRSASPRFGKSFDHARCGAKMNSNVAMSEEKKLPGPGAHQTQRDNTGAFYTLGCRTSVEPYSPGGSDSQAVVTRR